jgi:hypothetical protein
MAAVSGPGRDVGMVRHASPVARSALTAGVRAEVPVLAPAAAPGVRARVELAAADTTCHRDQVPLERGQLRGRAPRQDLRPAVGEVEAEAGGRRERLAGRRIAQGPASAGVCVGRQLAVGVNVDLAAGPAGLIVEDFRGAVGRASTRST